MKVPRPQYFLDELSRLRSRVRCSHRSSFLPSMEVEVKLRLPDASSHQKLCAVLSPFHSKTLIQENFFFDTPTSSLASNLAALRLRFYSLDSLCVLSLKSKPQISSGVSRIEEEEEQLDPVVGRACVAEPRRLASLESKILRRVREEYGVGGDGFVCLGGFKNVRAVYVWKGLKLEVDETEYRFGTSYEIECESGEPEKAKNLIEELLRENGISYSYSEASKFAVFRLGRLPQ